MIKDGLCKLLKDLKKLIHIMYTVAQQWSHGSETDAVV